jgi:hypothetical protein
MRFIHYSPDPVARLTDKRQDDFLEQGGAKPNGLWFSVGDEWKTYVEKRIERGDWASHALKYETEVIFAIDARPLELKNAAQIDQFTAEYGNISDRTRKLPAYRARKLPLIDWPSVAERYDAIIVDPHCRERQMPDCWYHGWDVASGCVWKARAANLEPINY